MDAISVLEDENGRSFVGVAELDGYSMKSGSQTFLFSLK